MKFNFTRLSLLTAAVAISASTFSAFGGVVDHRYDLQHYLDFCRNKGMFAAGATNIEVFFKDGTSIENNTIALMPNLSSYGQTVAEVISVPGTANRIASNGGTNLVSAQFVYGAKHVHDKIGNTSVAFLSENASANCIYESANLDTFGHDSSLQRLTKLVTSVAYTPMADDAFMSAIKVNETLIYRVGNGGVWSNGESVNTSDNALGGVVNLSSIRLDEATGDWRLEGWARYNDTATDTRTPLDIGTYFGDSGSPCFAWDAENSRFVFVSSMWASGVQTALPNWYLPTYNPSGAVKVMGNYTVGASFSGTETIQWSASDAETGAGTLTQGATSVTYTGKGSGNTIADSLGITFSSDDAENVQALELQGTVNMGAGALTFESGKWKLSETDGSYTLSSAGFEVKKGAELTLELTGTVSEEIRKVGEGILTVSGSGNNEAALVVGGGTTVYNLVKDENGNITDCTLGNAGETRLNRTDGYAASSVRLEGGVAIVVLMADNQFKTNTTAGDTFSFGNAGGLLNLNGHDLEWGVINQYGSGTGARIGNFTPLNGTTPGKATFTYTGTGTFAGSFTDEGADGAQLAVKYKNSAENATWTLTGNSSNHGGFTVEAGTLKLEGTKTPHVNFTDANDWAYASLENSAVSVGSGATFQLSHHALMSGDVTVASGGKFVLNQTVNAVSESVSGGARRDMSTLGITSLVGNVSLGGNASMQADTSSPVATTMKGNISGESGSVFTKTGSGLFVINGQVAVGTGTVEAGGVAVKNGENFAGTWTIREAGYLGVEGMNGDDILAKISTESSGVLALGADQTTAITNLGDYQTLYIGALGTLGKAVEYGATDLTLSANTEGNWLLGGGGGTLNVHFLLTGANNLIIGNDASGGTVHLTNTGNNFTGDIYIKGTGNVLTYADGALGSARVALSYGNTLGLNNADQLSILKDGAQGILAITQSQDLDLSDKETALGAAGDITYTGTLKVGETYRFGGSGNLTLDTDLSGAEKMSLDGQGNSGSSVTFARENAFAGDIVVGGGLYLESANSAGDISVHVGHAEALASVNSMAMQKGAMLDTDGRESLVVRNLSAESGSAIKNSGNTGTLLQLNVSDGTSATIENGVLVDANNNATLSLVKTGTGTLTMGANSSWSGGLTVMEGAVKGSIASGGIGAEGASIYVNQGATLSLSADAVGYSNLSSTLLPQTLIGSGTVKISNGTEMFLSAQSARFEGEIVVSGNTRLYVANGAQTTTSGTKYYTSQAFDNATIVVEAGSQARLTSSIQSMSGSAVSSYADYVISGSTYDGSASGLVQSQHDGALVIDHQATVYGNVTLAENATISSWSYNPTSSLTYWGSYTYRCTDSSTDTYANRYGIINKLGGTIRGKILGAGKTLTFGGNEGMTITADSANTYGDLVIANGNGNNTNDKFALRLDGGAAKSQTSTALGTGSVTLNEGLILRLAGTGSADNSHVVYTYENAISAGNGATIQSYNITNRLAGTVTMSGSTLKLATANGGVLELAGGISGNGTLNVGANSQIVLGSASAATTLARNGAATFGGNVVSESGADITLMAPAFVASTTTFTGTDSLTLRLAGTEDFTLGGITLAGSEITNDDGTTGTTATALSLNFDFTSSAVSSKNADSYISLSSDITADSTVVSLSLNMFNDIESGSYTLATGTLSGEFSLENTLNNRLSLTQNNGSLVLTVGADNRLYWAADGTTQSWNTTEKNWYQESSGGNVAFTSEAHVVLNSKGAANSTANSRETLTLSGDQTVGALAVKDENTFYEVTGSAGLSGTNLAVGLGGNLKLSTTAAAFTDGVRVDNASLEASGTALTANVTATNSGSFALSNNASLTGTLSLSDSNATINTSTVSGDIFTAGTGSLSMTNAVLGSHSVSFENGDSLALTGATLSGNLNWQKDRDAITSDSLSVEAGSVSSDATLQATAVSIASGSSLIITGSHEATVNSVTGSGALKMADGNTATLNLGSASLASLDLLGGTTNISGTVTLGNNARLSLGKATLNLNEGANVTATHFRSGDQGNDHPSVTNVNAGATLNITGSTNDDNTGSSFLLAHWKTSNSLFVLNGGTVNATNTSMLMSWDSGATFSALSGEANLKGIRFSSERGNADTFSLGSATEGSARINIGTDGITGIGTNDTVSLGEGTIGALGNYSISGNAVNLIGTKNGTIFDTNSYAVTVNAALNGTGILAKNGAGTLTIAGNGAGFTGKINVEAGTLALGGDAAFGALSGLSVADGATLDLSNINFSERTALSLAAGAVASIDSGAIFAFGELKSDTQYNIFDLSSGASLEGWDSNNLGVANFSVNGESMRDMGRVYVSLDKVSGSFIYYREEAYNLVWNGGENGVWNREESDTHWQQSIGDSQTSTHFANYDNVAFNSNANLTVAEAVKVGEMTIADGASVSLTETGTLSAESIAVGNGATLTFATKKAGYTAANISGAGTVELGFTDNWSNALKLGTGFSGETYITSGYIDLTGATVGKTLRLANGVNANSATGATTVSADLILEGRSVIHANNGKPITYTGTLTGENGVFVSNGASSHIFNAEVNLAGLETAHDSNTTTFNAKTTLGTATISKANATVNFNGETSVSALNISGGTVSFNGPAEITGRLNGIGGTLVTQGGELKLSYTGKDGNTIALLDGSKGKSATGTLRLAKNVSATVSGQMWGCSASRFVLEQGAGLANTQDSVSFSNRGTSDAVLRVTSADNAEYSVDAAAWELSSGHLVITASGDKTLANKLTGSSVENAGSGLLTIDNSGNVLSGIYASSGSISAVNQAGEVSLTDLYIADGLTVSVYTDSLITEANLSVAGTALFGAGAHLDANLTLESGSTLSVAENGLSMGSTVSLAHGVLLGDETLSRAKALNAGETLTLFTGVDSLELIGFDGESVTAYDPGTLISENRISAETYFAGLGTSRDYRLLFTETIDGGTVSLLFVPEPSAFGLLAGLGALALVASRRRRRG